MLFRQFDLSLDEEIKRIDQILDNDHLMPIELKVGCTDGGFTTLTVRAQKSNSPIERKRKRRFRRFVLFGGVNEDLNQLLEDENVRLIKRHDFFTELGAIIVVDYETKAEVR